MSTIPEKLEEIEVLGTQPADIIRGDARPFRRPTTTGKVVEYLQNILPRPVNDALHAHPVLDTSRCVGCGECDRACPPHAIQMIEKRPVIDYSLCIRCFCCQELCPAKAMESKKGFLKKQTAKQAT